MDEAERSKLVQMFDDRIMHCRLRAKQAELQLADMIGEARKALDDISNHPRPSRAIEARINFGSTVEDLERTRRLAFTFDAVAEELELIKIAVQHDWTILKSDNPQAPTT